MYKLKTILVLFSIIVSTPLMAQADDVSSEVAVSTVQRADINQQLHLRLGHSGSPSMNGAYADPGEVSKINCTNRDAFSSLRDIIATGGELYDVPQCKQPMDHNVLFFSVCLMLLFWSYQLSAMSIAFPATADDNIIAEISRAAGQLTITPFATALISYFALHVLVVRFMDFPRPDDVSSRANGELVGEFFYYVPLSDNLFMIMLICALGLSVTALYRIGLIQAHLGIQTSTSSKFIAIVQPSLSCSASILAIAKSGLFII